VRAKRVAISPGISLDPETMAATVSRIRNFASFKTFGGSSKLRALAMYEANLPVRSFSANALMFGNKSDAAEALLFKRNWRL
jgi:hypothetical protein